MPSTTGLVGGNTQCIQAERTDDAMSSESFECNATPKHSFCGEVAFFAYRVNQEPFKTEALIQLANLGDFSIIATLTHTPLLFVMVLFVKCIIYSHYMFTDITNFSHSLIILSNYGEYY